MGRPGYIFRQFRGTGRCIDAQHGDGVCCALAPQLVLFLGFRSRNIIIGLTDVSPGIRAPTLWNYDVCAQYPGVVGDGATVSLPCQTCMKPHRYLILQMHITGILNFCEIEVYIGSK